MKYILQEITAVLALTVMLSSQSWVVAQQTRQAQQVPQQNVNQPANNQPANNQPANQQTAPQNNAQLNAQAADTPAEEAPAEPAVESSLDKVIPGGVTAPSVLLEEVIGMIQAQTGAQIILGEGVGQKQVTFSISGNPTVRDVLESVLPASGFDYIEQENGLIRIDTQAIISGLKAPDVELITRNIIPQYVDVTALEPVLANIKSAEGTLLVDPDSQKIVVTDLPEIIEEMLNLVQLLDVPVETRRFVIRYGNAQDIADQLQGVLQTGEGELIVDIRNNTIIVKDTVDRLDMAEAIINELDIQIKPVFIPLAFALPEDVLPLVESMLTELGFLDFDPRTSRLIIWDIPSVVEQIREIVKLIDIPTQQVWIEVDIIRTNKDKTLTLGVSADYGDDIGTGGNPNAPSIGSASGGGNFFSFNPFISTSGGGLSLMDVSQGNYRIQVDAMVENRDAEIVASPRLLIEDGQVGSFTLGSQEPFAVRQQQNFFGGGGGGDFFTQQFREVGTTVFLEVYASEAGYVEMFINVEDTNSRRVELANVGDGLAIDGSFIETAITVKSGRTVVLGGIINREKSRSNSGVPILSSIPVLGNLFKNKSSKDNNQKMLVFITPRLMNIDDPYDFAQLDNIKRVLELQSAGATDFVDSEVAEKYVDWSAEEENEKAAIEAYLQEQGLDNLSVEKQQVQKQKEPSKKEQLESGVMQMDAEKE